MASKTTTVRPVRLPNELLEKMRAEVERSAGTRKGEPLTESAFIVAAVREKLAHMIRSRRGRSAKESARLKLEELKGKRVAP